MGIALMTVAIPISCMTKDDAVNNLLPASSIEKIETSYIEGCQKVERGYFNEEETSASAEMMEEVRSKLLSYQKSFELRYKVARNLSEGYPVGVIPAVDACQVGSERVKFFMDNQDSGNTLSTGWTGSWSIDGNGNTWHTFCVVYGAAFRFMTFNAPTEYLLLRLGNNKTIYMEPRVWNVYIDNEDNNNKNVLADGDFNPNLINKNGTNLQFWAISGKNTPGQNQDSQFPDMGFSYGVLGTFSSPVLGGAAGIGQLKTDDENSNNSNQLYSVDWVTNAVTGDSHVQGYGVDRTNDPGNTTFNLRRVR
ncbi:hypothetical protein Dfer_4637 [Dyadobacter fermentans DSM 18053]|uniref:Uncharacterized protein n=2 Tax=Dyadobacter fermentans TaxID=94254 RepID=C6W3Z0_DYAFD|nr:hypothetical protein Dfer_4637 [Dyadobacter fermentans DSM 18053]